MCPICYASCDHVGGGMIPSQCHFGYNGDRTHIDNNMNAGDVKVQGDMKRAQATMGGRAGG